MKFNIKSEKLKKAVIIALPIVFALTAAVALALLMRPTPAPDTPEPPTQNDQLNGGGETEKNDEGTSKKDVEVVAPVETPKENLSTGLKFRSKGNGTCAVVGIGDCSDRIVVVPNKSPEGDTVVEIAVGAFADCKTIVDVTVPDSVVSIGAGAFSGCSNLESVTVGDANPLYSSEDGVLFNKAKSTLLLYPAGKRDAVYVLPKSVTRIGEGAFASAPRLVELKFLGTKAQWKAVYVAPNNSALDEITITFSSNDK
jgi:hypothetical protein